jgi:hypothetical protein
VNVTAVIAIALIAWFVTSFFLGILVGTFIHTTNPSRED